MQLTEPGADWIGPREGARTRCPLKALGLGGHCGFLCVDLPDSALTGYLGLAQGTVYGIPEIITLLPTLQEKEALILFQHEDFILHD